MPRFRRPLSPVHTARRVAAALLTALALTLALRPEPAPASTGTADVVRVAVFAHDLPAGAVLAPADLAVAHYPPAAVPAGTVTDPDRLLRRVLAGSVRAREAVTDARLVGPGLTALLPAGQVAAPVRLADLSVAALVRTGDRVDVLATAPDAPAADVVAPGALVLATSGGAEPGAGLLLLGVDGDTAARLAAAATSATLTVTLPPP